MREPTLTEPLQPVRMPVSDPVLSGRQFRMLLDLWMVSDPWPLSKEDDAELTALLQVEAAKRGYPTVIEAYHSFRSGEKAGSRQKQQVQ